jgi:hypothetical protein
MLPWTSVKMTTASPVDSEGEVSELEAGVSVVPEVRLLHHNARVSLLLKMHTMRHQQIEHKQIVMRIKYNGTHIKKVNFEKNSFKGLYCTVLYCTVDLRVFTCSRSARFKATIQI